LKVIFLAISGTRALWVGLQIIQDARQVCQIRAAILAKRWEDKLEVIISCRSLQSFAETLPSYVPPVAAVNPFADKEKIIFSFATQDALAQWRPFSDAELGGQSTAALEPSETLPVSAHHTLNPD
jgi:hypothetical protein